MATKPTKEPVWASSGDKTDYGDAKAAAGWTINAGVPEKPSYKYFNWWQNLVYSWISYFSNFINNYDNFAFNMQADNYNTTSNPWSGNTELTIASKSSGFNSTYTFSADSTLFRSKSWELFKTTGNQANKVKYLTINIPKGLRNKQVLFSFELDTTTDYISNRAVMYAYDITNSTEITLISGDASILTGQSQMQGTFLVPATCESLRIGIKITSTNTTSYSIKIDNIIIKAQKDVIAGDNVLGKINGNVLTGRIGEKIFYSGETGTIVSAAIANIIPLTIPKGNWEIKGHVWPVNASSLVITAGPSAATDAGLSTANNTIPSTYSQLQGTAYNEASSSLCTNSHAIFDGELSLTADTTYYLNARQNAYASGTGDYRYYLNLRRVGYKQTPLRLLTILKPAGCFLTEPIRNFLIKLMLLEDTRL